MHDNNTPSQGYLHIPQDTSILTKEIVDPVRNQIEHIDIPKNITKIGRDAFRDCSRLKSITIPNSVTYIGEYTFKGCTSLTFAVIPKNLESKNENYWRERGINIEKTTLITQNQLSTWASSQKLSRSYTYHELAILYQLQKDDNFTPSWPELGKLTSNLMMGDLLEVLPEEKIDIVLPKVYKNLPINRYLENHSLFNVTPARSRQEHEQKTDRLKNDGYAEYKNPDDPTITIQLKEVSPAASSAILKWLTLKEVATLLRAKVPDDTFTRQQTRPVLRG